MNKDFILPIVTLSLICLFISGVLAVVNNSTKPKIENDAEVRAKIEMKKIIETEEFIEIYDVPDVPKEVSRIFTAKDKNGEDLGYIFMVVTKGYGGNVNFICGIDNDGRIIRAIPMSHKETPSFAARVFIESHIGQYWGRERNGIEEVMPVSGATISSTAFKNAMRRSLEAFKIVRGADQADTVQEEQQEENDE